MKFLITGMSRKQCIPDSDCNCRQYTQTPSIVKYILEELGCEVDWRAVVPGENIDHYDRVIVFISYMKDSYAYSGLWAISQREDAIFSADDWQIYKYLSSHRLVARRIQEDGGLDKYPNTQRQLFRTDNYGPNKFREEAFTYRKEIESGVIKLASSPWKKAMLNLFPWGDFSKLKVPCERATLYDPSYLTFNERTSIKRNWSIPRHRHKVWTCASLSQKPDDFIKKINLENVSDWRTLYLGKYPSNSDNEDKRIGPVKNKDEFYVCNEYINNYGVISLPYTSIEGSGWWRARYVQSCAYRNILLSSKKDSENMGASYHLHDKLDVINKFDEYQLNRLGDAQAEWFMENITYDEVLFKTIQEQIVNDNIPKVKGE